MIIKIYIIYNHPREQGSEALGSVGSQIGFVHVRLGLQFVALYTAIGLVPRRCMYILSEYYCIGYNLQAGKRLTAIGQGLHTHYINCMKMLVIKKIYNHPIQQHISFVHSDQCFQLQFLLFYVKRINGAPPTNCAVPIISSHLLMPRSLYTWS